MQRAMHLVSTGNARGIGVILDPNRLWTGLPIDAWAEKNAIKVYGWQEESQICYFAGLHELGHVFSGHCSHRESWAQQNVIESECEAWVWALDNTMERPSFDTLDFIFGDYALGSYMKSVGTSYWDDFNGVTISFGWPAEFYNELYKKSQELRYAQIVVQGSNGIVFTNPSQT